MLLLPDPTKFGVLRLFKRDDLISAFCILAGFIGARVILIIHPAESMRPEPPKTGKRILLEGCHSVWSRVSFSWKMVIHEIEGLENIIMAIFGILIGIPMVYVYTGLITLFFVLLESRVSYEADMKKVLKKAMVFFEFCSHHCHR